MELSDAPNDKSPVSEDITSEPRKMMASEKIPESKMTKINFKIINLMYDMGEIPKNMDIGILLPDFKKGVMKDTDNYRGRIPSWIL
ncbi:hypothetical protein AYI68_g7303 [Smittium mucronatum]|uniref:Uncharacterized protein n=1 Tax=Smittium mucronatum TaxID=133383 RepID=A0A1R0GP21_9FUNG|nr:hypothetical protein AYI68_g7303 [Smittium mucronatum]